MSGNEETVMKKGIDCLYRNLGVIETEMFISAIMKSDCGYTQWRQEYFENAYKDGSGSQLANFLNAAANNDPRGLSFGLSSVDSAKERRRRALEHTLTLPELEYMKGVDFAASIREDRDSR